MRFKSLIVLLLVVLVGCGSGAKDGISVDDLAIVKVDDENQVVKYGMSRAEAEKVLGKGEKVKNLKNYFKYNSDVMIMYRNEKVVGISIGEETADSYQTSNGLKIGMLKDEIKEIYGSQHLGDNESNLDYAYDSVNKKFLDGSSYPDTLEENQKIYMISAMFDEDGYAYTIMLLDRQMAMQGK